VGRYGGKVDLYNPRSNMYLGQSMDDDFRLTDLYKIVNEMSFPDLAHYRAALDDYYKQYPKDWRPKMERHIHNKMGNYPRIKDTKTVGSVVPKKITSLRHKRKSVGK